MEVEAIELIQKTAVKAHGEDIVRATNEPSGVYYLRNWETGNLERVHVFQPARCHELFTLENLCRAVEHFARPGTDVDPLPVPIVFCGRGLVVALLDESQDRQERLVVQLPFSAEYELLTGLRAQRESRAQRAFVDLLRIDLAGCVSPDLVAGFRALKFAQAKGGEARVDTGREQVATSLKREIVTDGGDIPDEIGLSVYVYADLAAEGRLLMPVKCAVTVNLDEGTFCLIPLAGELENAQRETDDWIHAELTKNLGDHAVVLRGKPN